MDIDIKHIAKLAHLHIEPEDMDKFAEEMSGIVDMFNQLPDVEEALLMDENNPMQLREDVAEDEKFTRDEMLQNAPLTNKGCLVVPKTVE